MEDMVLGIPRASRRGGRSVVTADVDGHPLWFASRDVRLVPSPEAFASALLIPAAEAGRRLASAAPVDPLWLRRQERRRAILERWWGLGPLPPALTAGAPGRRPGPRARTGVCFSGGADSFWTLRASGLRVDDLVAVHGFDVPLGDEAQWARVERSARAVGKASNTKTMVVVTNLRDHPSCRHSDWERAHGGALAAVGHLLTGRIGRLLVSSSFSFDDDSPWGSHYRLDPLWASTRLEVTHVGAELWRSEKLSDLADDPLVQRHLRVCWQADPGPTGNCGRCEKCLRTELSLEALGRRSAFACFASDAPLDERVGNLPAIGSHVAPVYRLLIAWGLPTGTAAAVRALLERSEAVREAAP